MHTLQPKHIKLKKEEIDEFVKKLNISISQLPKISNDDPCIPKDCSIGDVLRIERVVDGKIEEYFRVVS
jgi:DNA-directed RNA polymerase subunit H (RpoH/RPB5)